MAEIICPLCGKPNPSDLEECQYCQAPLKSSAFAPPEGEGGVPDWLSALQSETGEAESQAAQPPAGPTPEQAIPDWLQGSTTPSQEAATGGEPLPDWLSGQAEQPVQGQPPPAKPGEPGAEEPDWLTSLLAETPAGEVTQPAPQEEALEWPASPEEPAKSEAFTEALPEEPQAAPSDQTAPPDWLAELEAAPPEKPAESAPQAKEEAGKEEDRYLTTLPDWVSQVSRDKGEPAAEEPEAGLAPAELPGWLEAMRPVEAASPTAPIEDLSGADMVTAGPLVGLRGVISAEPDAVRARKPAAYSIKLRVTDEQRARVGLLEELLAAEQKPKPLPAQPVITSQYIFRLVIAAVLLLPIIWAIIAGSQHTPLPVPSNFPGVNDFVQQVRELPDGAPVLLAFDYEAGFSGEMNIAASSVVTQLMIKNAYLTLVTTSSSGPALAESFIKKLGTGPEGNQGIYSNYADLGYIPGGTIGLIGLVKSPRDVLPYSLDGINVWSVAPLNSVHALADFSAVIVITNDPDTARAWIEQAGPALNAKGTPLLMVTSAQAEPLVRPYFEGAPRQIQGLVAGIVGGLAYGSSVGNIQTNGMWDAFSIGILVSVLIILTGSVVNAILKALALSTKKEK
jgi:hypothetical protein